MLDVRHSVHRAARFLQWALWIAIALFGLKYCFEVRNRLYAESHPEDWWTEVSTVPGGAYTAKLHFIGNRTILLRLYRTGNPTLLAERTYREAGVRLVWTAHELIYDTSDDSYLGGGIQLPPTRIDRLLAKLP